MQKTLKKLFLIFLLTELLFAYAPAFAQTPAPSSYYTGVSGEIEKYLCNPTSGGTGILYQCINQIYKFAIVTASIMGVFFIVIAGYVYMSAEGNKESVDKAKDILVSTITSLVILLAGYVLLNALNPDLIQFHGNTLQPVNFTSPPTTTTGTGGATSNPNKSSVCPVSTTFSCNDPGTATACAQYSSYVQQYGAMVNNSNVNGVALLQAIMYHESRCKINVSSGIAYGLMQMLPSTANNPTFKSQCGITATIDGSWFQNNPGPSICLAAAYLNYLSNQAKCGSDAGTLLSAYANGKCGTSALCPQAVTEMLACYNP
jgi:hypothetical protein